MAEKMVYWSVFRTSLAKSMQYHADFWIQQIFNSGIGFFIQYFIFYALYQSQPKGEMGGLTFAQMNLNLTLAMGFRRIVVGEGGGFIGDDIYSGGLNRFLLQPVSLLGYKFAEHCASFVTSGIQLFIGLLIYVSVFGFQELQEIKWEFVPLAMALLMAATFVYFLIAVVIDCVCFWMDQVWSLHVMLKFTMDLTAGVLIPLTLFSSSTRALIEYFPFHFMGSLPAEILLGKKEMAQLGMPLFYLTLWIAIFYLLFKMIFKKGLKVYSGIGI
jgi:ABC-2 type transport system permease protein